MGVFIPNEYHGHVGFWILVLVGEGVKSKIYTTNGHGHGHGHSTHKHGHGHGHGHSTHTHTHTHTHTPACANIPAAFPLCTMVPTHAIIQPDTAPPTH